MHPEARGSLTGATALLQYKNYSASLHSDSALGAGPKLLALIEELAELIACDECTLEDCELGDDDTLTDELAIDELLASPPVHALSSPDITMTIIGKRIFLKLRITDYLQ